MERWRYLPGPVIAASPMSLRVIFFSYDRQNTTDIGSGYLLRSGYLVEKPLHWVHSAAFISVFCLLLAMWAYEGDTLLFCFLQACASVVLVGHAFPHRLMTLWENTRWCMRTVANTLSAVFAMCLRLPSARKLKCITEGHAKARFLRCAAQLKKSADDHPHALSTGRWSGSVRLEIHGITAPDRGTDDQPAVPSDDSPLTLSVCISWQWQRPQQAFFLFAKVAGIRRRLHQLRYLRPAPWPVPATEHEIL